MRKKPKKIHYYLNETNDRMYLVRDDEMERICSSFAELAKDHPKEIAAAQVKQASGVALCVEAVAAVCDSLLAKAHAVKPDTAAA